MGTSIDQISSVFFEEANELLDDLENQLLTLEENPEDQEVIGAIFRAMHTIKGSSGMFGFEEIQKFTHEIENAFDLVRSGEIPADNGLVSITLQARDHIRSMLGVEITDEIQAESEKLLALVHDYIDSHRKNSSAMESPVEKSVEKIATENAEASSGKENSWRIIFRPCRSIMMNGTRPELLVKELAEMGESTVIAFSDEIPPLSEINAEDCYLSWDIFLTTSKTEADIQSVFIFLDNESKVSIEKIDMETTLQKKLGEILVSRNNISRDEFNRIINEQKKIGQVLVESKAVTENQLHSALAEQEHLRKISQKKDENHASGASAAANQTIRVNSEKLDSLIDLVGEMVTFNARLAQLALEIQNPQLTAISELSERLVFGLRDTAMDMRMLPIGTIFSRFRRLVHDLSKQLNKDIDLNTEGAETELDKTVIEKLNDPLIHLIRNSADHGIETPEERIALGKDRQGIVTLTAKHAGGFVLITVADDGAGLNKDAIYKKALEKGLLKPDDNLSDQEIYEMIFKPGFSTNAVVTNVSGRGVGMDVVRKDIGSLGGTVSVETEAGKGSKFILKIPLTLAIIDGMLVQINERLFVIPLTNVEECVELAPENETEKLCTHITSRGDYLPCINMVKYFEMPQETKAGRQVVVVNDNESKIGIIVDSVIGNHQTVIKPLGELFKNVAGISGATILGDGSVALILDILRLSQIVKKIEMVEK